MARFGWYVIRTRSRHEKIAEKELGQRVEEVFLPTIRTLSSRKDRHFVYNKVLFPGYIFVHTAMTREQRVNVIKARGVVEILGNSFGPYPCREHEVESIRVLVGQVKDLSVYTYLPKGSLVLVKSGPLRGVVGTVVRAEDGARKIICSIELLGRSVAARLDRAAVESFDDMTGSLLDRLADGQGF
ncbi:MAG: hypothetical protein GXP49_13745 [Deltaproteobacteria bacterium]|nr:hypothetical protein [Deltaproteobacteria bacterium]